MGFENPIVGNLLNHSLAHFILLNNRYISLLVKIVDPAEQKSLFLTFLSFYFIYNLIMNNLTQSLHQIYQHQWFSQIATITIVLMLYLVYFLRYKSPHFIYTGDYDPKKKNLRKTPPPYPNGWFNIIKASQLKPEGVRAIDINGHNLVVFRGANKEVYALAAYCLHMGANLGVGGEVVNKQCIQCPFHGWLYDGKTGNCVDHDGKPLELKSIEYCEDIAKKDGKMQWKQKPKERATLRKYPVCELNGYIYVWIHALEQFYQKPEYPLIDITNFLKNVNYRGKLEHRINCHIQDIPANGADLVHFKYVHNIILNAVKSLYFKWDAKWKLATDPDIKSFFEHPRKDVRDFKQRVYKQLIEAYPNKEILSIGDLQNWIHLPLLGDYFMLSGTIIQVGMGTVFIFFKSPWFEYVVHHYVRPQGKNYQIVIHDCYISGWVPYWLSAKIIEGQGWQVVSDMIVWQAKSFTKRTYLNEKNQSDQIMKEWTKWAAQFYRGCNYESDKEKYSW